MKLRIHNQQDELIRTIEIIDEFEDVRILKSKILSTNENSKYKKFFLINENKIVLNDDKILKFYKIINNEIISIRHFQNFLQGDERILEVFVSGLFPSIMYLIVTQNDRISGLRSTIENIVQNINGIYDRNSNEMFPEQTVDDTDHNNGYYKLIISCDNRSAGGENQTIEMCRDLHDRYFIDLYLKKFPSICRPIDYENDWKEKLLDKIKKLKEIINGTNADKFNGILSMFRSPLVKSRFLFVTELAEYFNCCCNGCWNEVFDVSNEPVRDYFFAELHICINEYIERNENTGQNENIGQKIAIEALNKFGNYLQNDCVGWQGLMKSLLDTFLIGQYNTDEIQQMFAPKEVYSSFKVWQNQKYHEIDIPSQCHKIAELKFAVSFQTNVDVGNLYFIKFKSIEQPTDADEIKFNNVYNCRLEIVSGMENIEIVKEIAEGAFAKILLCKNTSTNRTFGLKKPRGNENLYQEISNHFSICHCEHIKTYTELILYDECVCVAMEFLSGGTLISRLGEFGHLHETKISKLSHQILTQIGEMHKNGMIHRDINGDNIVFDDKDEAKLIDFGISIHCSCFDDENFVKKLFKQSSYGTLGYFAPELLIPGTEGFTDKIDIWSFGVVVIEMINGKPVRRVWGILGPTHGALKIRTPKPMSENLMKFYHSCLKSNPEERSSAYKLIKFQFIRDHHKKLKYNANNKM